MSWTLTLGMFTASAVELRPKPKRGSEKDVKDENIVN